MIQRGYLITLEGGEGVGKSTQARHIKLFLEKHNYRVLLTREPGGCDNAETIRHLLVKGEVGRWDLTSEYLLFSAARRQHLLEVVWPALDQNTWVVCDRFYDSSRAYQGAGHGLDAGFMDIVYHQIAGTFEPDLTFIMDMPSASGLERTLKRQSDEDRFEKMTTVFHERVRQAFLQIAHAEPKRCRIVKADQSIKTVSANIDKHLYSFMAQAT